MAVDIIWTCDGCGDQTNKNPNSSKGGDWHRITVRLDGFKGYPVGAESNGETVYELCPSCQRRLNEQANPRQWPRMAKGEPA